MAHTSHAARSAEAMWASATHKVRIIRTEESGDDQVIEVFRWSEGASGWLHLADVEAPEQLDAFLKQYELDEFDERLALASKFPGK